MAGGVGLVPPAAEPALAPQPRPSGNGVLGGWYVVSSDTRFIHSAQ